MSESKPPRVSAADREYMRRLGEANRMLLRDEHPPATLREMFDRMERIERNLGKWAKPGIPGGDGDLASHQAYLERRRALSAHGA